MELKIYNEDLITDETSSFEKLINNRVDDPTIMLRQNEYIFYRGKSKRVIIKNVVTGSKSAYLGTGKGIFRGGISEKQVIRNDVSKSVIGTIYLTNRRLIFLADCNAGFEIPLSKLTSLKINKSLKEKNKIDIYSNGKHYEMYNADHSRMALIYLHLIKVPELLK